MKTQAFGCQLEIAAASELRPPFRSGATGLADFWVQERGLGFVEGKDSDSRISQVAGF